MSHVRTEIRDAVSTLVTGLVTTGSRVNRSRVYSLDQDELPSLSVFINSEESTAASVNAPAMVRRSATLVIEGHALADLDIDKRLDDIAAEVEVAMSAAIVVQGRNLPAQLKSTEIQLTGEGEAMIGVIRLNYSIMYATPEDAPQSLS